MSPQASSFFYVGKKDEGIRPCQDYRYVNEHTIKDAYPLPLISDLIDKVKDAKLFTKFDIRSGYNNIQIKEGDEWKAAFITPKGLFEPTVDEPPLYPAPIYAILRCSVYLHLTSICRHTTLPAD